MQQLWRDPKKMLNAAEAMKLTANDLYELKIIDGIIKEPLSGAHRDKDLTTENIKKELTIILIFKQMNKDEIFNHRKSKFLSIGRGKGFVKNPEELSTLSHPQNNFAIYFDKFKDNKKSIFIVSVVILLVLTISYYFL